jgi:hypothetical protein
MDDFGYPKQIFDYRRPLKRQLDGYDLDAEIGHLTA